jgi:hypothetical protein
MNLDIGCSHFLKYAISGDYRTRLLVYHFEMLCCSPSPSPSPYPHNPYFIPFTPISTSATTSEVLLLPPCPRILVEVPLHIALLVIQRTRSYLKQPHTHSGAYFSELDGLVAGLDEDVVANFNGVFDVFESIVEVST